MKIGVPKECAPGERRVALTPDVCQALVKAGLEVLVETGAGRGAFFTDEDYTRAGARVVPDAADVFGAADILVKVQKPTDGEVAALRTGAVLIGLLQPATSQSTLDLLAKRNVTALAMEAVPRISRAQSMDALSSQATVAGYKGVLLAAAALPKFFPMLTTAAGTIRPARVLVLGAGVAGLQAIATARRLGAVVLAFDVRPAVKEQVESLGAKFLQVELADRETEDRSGYAKELSAESHRREMELLAHNIKDMDAVISTAAIPGKRAPLLITAEMVASMRPGSVIVDLAAETGGNCALTEAGKDVVVHGVTIIGAVNLPASLPVHASQMYARNIQELLKLLVAKDGTLKLDFADEIVKGACVTHAG